MRALVALAALLALALLASAFLSPGTAEAHHCKGRRHAFYPGCQPEPRVEYVMLYPSDEPLPPQAVQDTFVTWVGGWRVWLSGQLGGYTTNSYAIGFRPIHLSDKADDGGSGWEAWSWVQGERTRCACLVTAIGYDFGGGWSGANYSIAFTGHWATLDMLDVPSPGCIGAYAHETAHALGANSHDEGLMAGHCDYPNTYLSAAMRQAILDFSLPLGYISP